MERLSPDTRAGGEIAVPPQATAPALLSRRTSGDRREPDPPESFVSSYRWALLIVLLVVEVMVVTVCCDSEDTGAGIESLLDLSRMAFQVVAVATGIWLVFRGGRREGPPSRVRSVDRIGWVYVPVHLASMLGFIGLTMALSRGGPSFLPPALRAAAWIVLGAAALGTWLAIAAPSSNWVSRAGEHRGLLLGCLALGLLAWALARSAEYLWRPLAWGTLRIVHASLRMADPEAFCDPASYRVGMPSFHVEIAAACSGYEGIGMILALLGVYLWVDRRSLRFPHALILLPLGVSVIWLVNAARIAAMIWIGASGYRDVALGGFHSQAGWLAFIAVGLGLIALARLGPLAGLARDDELISRGGWPSAPYLVPFLGGIAALMLTRAVSGEVDRLYPLRVVAVGGLLWSFRGTYAAWRWRPSWQAVALGVVAFVAWINLTSHSADVGPGLGDSRMDPGGPWGAWAIAWISFRIAGAVITVPLAEELAFRAYLTRRLIKSDFSSLEMGAFSWPSCLVSSALFGLLHHSWLAGTVAGLLFSLALYRRGRVADAVLAHATANACLAAYVVATGQWWLWD